MALFRYIGSAPPRPDGTYQFRVRAKKFSVTFSEGETFEVPDNETFVLQCIRGHLDWETQTPDYEEVVE